MYCNHCEEVTHHILIRRHALVESHETAYLLQCDICKLKKWVVSEFPIDEWLG